MRTSTRVTNTCSRGEIPGDQRKLGEVDIRQHVLDDLLIVHGLLAVALLGALTHQAMSVLMPVRQPAGRFRQPLSRRAGAGYATAVCVLWVLTFIMGAWIYTKYRIYVRIPIEQAGYWKTRASSN